MYQPLILETDELLNGYLSSIIIRAAYSVVGRQGTRKSGILIGIVRMDLSQSKLQEISTDRIALRPTVVACILQKLVMQG